MINERISKRVLTLGCDYRSTQGGISTVINNYSKIYQTFRFLPTSKCKGRISNLIVLFFAIIIFCVKCCSRSIAIIHIHTASNNSFRRKKLFIDIAHFFGKKIILHVHGGSFKEYTLNNRQMVEKTISKVDTIIALSTYWKEYFNAIYPKKNVIVVPNIVGYPKIDVKEREENLVVKATFLGLICKNKGIYDLVEVIKDNKEYLRGRFMLHIGGNGETEKLCKYIEVYELADIIKFEGWLGPEKKSELLSVSNVFILPSYIEGVPISILEAMTYRLPILSTNVGGIPEIVAHGENGFLYDAGDKGQLFTLIKKMIEDKEMCRRMGDASLKRVKPHLPDNISAVLENLYINLLN